jgi:Insertion element 4 transposase N-terminal/Transposase DDE domain
MIFPVAGVTRIVKAARDRLPDRVAIGVLTRTFPPELVDEVIDKAKAREQRRRSLPARLTVYFVLAMWLWREHGYEEVLRQLLDGLAWSGADDGGPHEADVAWSGSITKARTRLGPDPLRLLFTRAAGPTGSPEMPGCFWRGRRLSVIDGSTMDVADSKANRAAFDGPSNDAGPGAFPQVRLLVHAECGSKALLEAVFDGYRVAETVLAQRVLGSFGPGMLVMADRQFLSWKLWREAAATKADLLWRVSDSFTLPLIKRLPDGSYLSRLNPPRKKDGDPITVRVIEYTVTTRDKHGEQHSELFCLATTMLDPHTAPIEEIPALYHDRWRGETLLDVVKTDVRGGADVLLRSQSPAGVRQEMWALFCLYQALAHLVGDAARHYRIDPDRISFLRARNAARRSVSWIQAGFPPSPTAAGT